MIYFAVTEQGRFGIDNYLASPRGVAFRDRIRSIPYGDLLERPAVPAGTWIFSDLDHLTPAGVEIATRIWDALHAAGHTLLNHPAQVRHRYELLRRLHETGASRVRVVRGDEPKDGLSYPVFLREEEEHTGTLTELLDTKRALRGALLWARVHGHRPSRVLVVEFCDTSGDDGLFRKYSAYCLAGRVLPRHVHIGDHWVVKAATGDLQDSWADEENRYIEDNPHEEWIREMFSRANTDYGRIDYGLCEGKPQIWEINTNPTIGRGRQRKPRTPELARFRELQEPGKQVFYEEFAAAFESVDSRGDTGAEIPVAIPEDLRRRWRREARRRQLERTRAQRRSALLERVSALPLIRSAHPHLKAAARRIWGPIT